jgi:hypothetical protein
MGGTSGTHGTGQANKPFRKIRREEKTQIILKCILKHKNEHTNVQQEAQ